MLTLQVRDRISSPGSDRKPNEDVFGAAGKCAWVLDGATNLSKPLFPGFGSNAEWLVQTGSAHLTELYSQGASLEAGLDRAMHHIRAKYLAAIAANVGVDGGRPPVAAGIVVERTSIDKVAMVSFSDCVGLVAIAGQPVTVHGGNMAAAELERREARRFISDAPSHLSLLERLSNPLLAEAKSARNLHQNRTGGTWLFGTDTVAYRYFERSEIDLNKRADILLMSDGFFCIVDTYQRYDVEGLMARAKSHGLSQILSEIRKIEEEDAEIRRFPRHKVSDDATAVLITCD